MKRKYCIWKYNDIDDYYDASCGNGLGWLFNSGDLSQNNVKYCMFCGHRIKVESYQYV